MMRSSAVPRVRPQEFVPFSGQAHFIGGPSISLTDVPVSVVPVPVVPEPEPADADVETLVSSQTSTIFDEELFLVNDNNDGFDMDQLIDDNSGPDLNNCVGAMTKLNDIKDIAASWNIELTDHKYTKQLKDDICDFIMECTLKLTKLEASIGG